jgi:gamma-tubulin complex component 2
MTTCTMFATHTTSLGRSLQGTDPGGADTAVDETKLEKLDLLVNKYEDNFSHHLKVLVDALNYYAATESVVLLGLVSNLDWNRDWGVAA